MSAEPPVLPPVAPAVDAAVSPPVASRAIERFASVTPAGGAGDDRTTGRRADSGEDCRAVSVPRGAAPVSRVSLDDSGHR